jgi:endogenous inhibitor of DNA gyrase (YacG/DUF329 family)
VKLVCPICKKVVENAPDDLLCRPFCSPQCKLADLHSWLNGAYRIATSESSDGTEASMAESGSES